MISTDKRSAAYMDQIDQDEIIRCVVARYILAGIWTGNPQHTQFVLKWIKSHMWEKPLLDTESTPWAAAIEARNMVLMEHRRLSGYVPDE